MRKQTTSQPPSSNLSSPAIFCCWNFQWKGNVYKNTKTETKKINILTHSLLLRISHLPPPIFRSPQFLFLGYCNTDTKQSTKNRHTPPPLNLSSPSQHLPEPISESFSSWKTSKFMVNCAALIQWVMHSTLGIVETFICFRKYEYDDLCTYNVSLNYKSFFSRNFSVFLFSETKKNISPHIIFKADICPIWLNGSDIEHVHPNLYI